jgi:hypothetical protein
MTPDVVFMTAQEDSSQVLLNSDPFQRRAVLRSGDMSRTTCTVTLEERHNNEQTIDRAFEIVYRDPLVWDREYKNSWPRAEV